MSDFKFVHELNLEILNLFTEKDIYEERAWMLRPFSIENFVMATDAHCMVYFDKNLAPEFGLPVGYENPTKILGIIPKGYNRNLIIPVDTIKEGLSKCEMVDDTDTIGKDVDCDACSGMGEVEWEFDYNSRSFKKDFECPMCNGDGLSEKSREVPNGKKIYKYDSQIQVEESTFAARLINKLVEVAALVKQDHVILIYQNDAGKASVFKIGEIYVLLMPTYRPNDLSEIKFVIKENNQ